VKINWQSEANKALDLVAGRMMEAHRGAFVWHAPTNTMLLFGNDGYPEQIENLKKLRPGLTIRATACDDYSFVMLVESDDASAMTDRLWDSWAMVKDYPPNEGGAFEAIQRRIASARIDRHFCGTEKPWEQVDWRTKQPA
jgi:hypothetical protein